MLLRRMTQHVKEQNWFAVALDFFIVVAGILIAFQITNWNEARQDQALSRQILDRLDDEFAEILGEVDVALSSHQRNMDGLIVIIEAIDQNTLPEEKVEAFKAGLLYSYTHRSSTYRSATYTEIIANGRIGLIEEENLREALLAFERTVDEAVDAFLHIRMVQSEFTEAITRHSSYQTPVKPPTLEKSFMEIGDFDFEAMKSDPEFRNAAHELLAAQRFYFFWHLASKERAKDVQEILSSIHEETN